MGATAYQSTVLNGTRAHGPVVRVEPQVFVGIVGRSPTGLVVAAEGRALRANQYLIAYRGLWFTTTSRSPLDLPRSIEVIRVKTLALSV